MAEMYAGGKSGFVRRLSLFRQPGAMRQQLVLFLALGLFLRGQSAAAGLSIGRDGVLAMPLPGDFQLRILTPDLLELELIRDRKSVV